MMKNDLPAGHYLIPAENMGELRLKLAKFNRKAAKLKLEPITLTEHDTRVMKFKRDEFFAPVEITVYEVSVTGTIPSLNGWTFVGRLDRTMSTPLVMTVPGQTMPEKYRTATNPVCDHCKTARYRKDTFVLTNEAGEYKEIGRNCLADFISRPIEGVVSMFSYLKSLSNDLEDKQGSIYGSGEYRSNIHTILEMASAVIRAEGWVSRSESQASDGRKKATSTSVSDQLYHRKSDKHIVPITPEPQDAEIATKTIDYVQNVIGPRQNKSDYEHNLSVLFNEDMIPVTKQGLVVAAVSSYLRWAGEEVKRKHARSQKLASAHFGKVGERLTITAVVSGLRYIDGDFGTTTICEFLTPDGNVVKWFASNAPELKIGQSYSIKGTVKDHTEYKDIRQTVLTRCVLTKIDATPEAEQKNS